MLDLCASRGCKGAGVGPLSEHCARTPCLSFDRAVAELTSRVAKGCVSTPVAEIGRCGDLRYIEEIPGGIMGTFKYYDAQGALVSVLHYNVEHPGAGWTGPPQTCAPQREIDLCASHR